METVGDNDKRDVRRPMNAFLIFCKRHRSIVREKNPDLDNRSVTRILGDLWANLKDEEKVVYTDLAKQYKDAFMKANPDYKWHNPEKAVTCPKSGALTNAKVLKNEINLLPEGSIMPGKLADPCNMGGLSLLLMAGEQQSRIDQNDMSTITGIYRPAFPSHQNINTGTTDVTNRLSDNSTNDQHAGAVKTTEDINKVVSDSAGGIKSIVPFLDLNEKPPSTNKDKSVVVEKPQSINELENPFSRQITTHPFTKLIDSSQTKPLLYQAVAAPKLPAKSLLADAFKDSIEKDGHSDILKDNSASTKMANFENQGHVLENLSRGDIETKLVCKVDEKENITQKVVTDVKLEEDSIKDDESPMVTCGKLVVNHIIDKLFSSDLATAGRKAVNANKDEVDGGKDNRDKDEETDQDTVGSNFKNQVQLNQNIEDTKREVEVDQRELNELTVVKSEVLRETDMDKDKSDNGLNEGNDSGSVQNKKSGKWKSSMAASRGEDSTESEEVDDYQPVRKSRRRNRGQRYQELINEGIIQLSKERMAALQQPAKKEESPDEDVQPIEAYNSYVLPETAIRRIRKRTTSESAKDKIFHTDDVKRYKTGDFDLEAQIAILPVCSVENMGRKRGFARQRHNSECIHTQRKLSDIDHLSSPQPVFDVKKIVSLPPHVKVMPDTSQEPVVGSRKRKARKHSITHMVPAPATLIKNGKVKSEVNGLGPCLIKPSETSSSEISETKNLGDVAMETSECVHSNCAETCKIASECETVTNENPELNTCDKTVDVPLSDCAQTGCDQCCVSDSHLSPIIETQSGNSSGALIKTTDTVCQSEQLQTLDLDKSGSTMESDSMKSDKNEVLYPNSKSYSDEVHSDQIDAINDGYKGAMKTETDVNSNNTINYE